MARSRASAGDAAFYQVILRSLLQGFNRQSLVVLPRQHDDRHVRRFFQQPAEGLGALAVGKIQIEQHQRRRLFLEGSNSVGQTGDTADVQHGIALDEPQADQVRV
jgi:hypothetical protein